MWIWKKDLLHNVSIAIFIHGNNFNQNFYLQNAILRDENNLRRRKVFESAIIFIDSNINIRPELKKNIFPFLKEMPLFQADIFMYDQFFFFVN